MQALIKVPMTEDILLSIVIPAYNEEARIGQTLQKIREYLARQDYAAEIIVVDDGSRDRTAEKAAEMLRGMKNGRIIRRRRNAGKGYSVKEGILHSQGELVLFSDADLSTPIEELEKFLPWFHAGYDVVLGSRAFPDSDIQIRQNFFREFMGKSFNVFVRLWLIKGIPDTQCGFKLFRGKAARDVFSQVKTRGFSFDVEALYLCLRSGYKIKQVPVCWRNSPPSKVRIFKSSIQMLLELVLIRLAHRKNTEPSGQPAG
jgi:dolichyl-phosphate beta-glucosyltransferase